MNRKASTKQHTSRRELNKGLRFGFCPGFWLLLAALMFSAACIITEACADTFNEHLDPTEILIEHLAEITASPVESAIDVRKSYVQPDVARKSPTVPDTPAVKAEPNDTPNNQPTQKTSDQDQISYIESQHKLWQAGIAVPREQSGNAARKKLLQTAEKIRSVKFVPAKVPEPFIVIRTPAKAEPNETVGDEQPQQQALTLQAAMEPPRGPLTPQTLRIIEEQSAHPQTQKCPFELAELLFRTGHLKLAAVFYQEALGRINPDDAALARNRAWILFQTANCLREHQQLQAKEFYTRLITEYPACPWFDIARTWEQLIDWSEKEKPQMLIQHVAVR